MKGREKRTVSNMIPLLAEFKKLIFVHFGGYILILRVVRT